MNLGVLGTIQQSKQKMVNTDIYANFVYDSNEPYLNSIGAS